jgi:hypothetical protein
MRTAMPPGPRRGGRAGGLRIARTAGSAAAVFELLWETLADILGTAATATLLRRAARAAAQRFPELDELAVAKEGLEYRHKVPESWKDSVDGMRPAFCELVRQLRPLLIELTGSIVIRRLDRNPELRERGTACPVERKP